VILVLFLISVGVMELILRNDRKQPQDSAVRDRESAQNTPLPLETTAEVAKIAAVSGATTDLLALMNAVDSENSGVKPQLGRVASPSPREAPQNTGAPEMVESAPEYNREDAGVR